MPPRIKKIIWQEEGGPLTQEHNSKIIVLDPEDRDSIMIRRSNSPTKFDFIYRSTFSNSPWSGQYTRNNPLSNLFPVGADGYCIVVLE